MLLSEQADHLVHTSGKAILNVRTLKNLHDSYNTHIDSDDATCVRSEGSGHSSISRVRSSIVHIKSQMSSNAMCEHRRRSAKRKSVFDTDDIQEEADHFIPARDNKEALERWDSRDGVDGLKSAVEAEAVQPAAIELLPPGVQVLIASPGPEPAPEPVRERDKSREVSDTPAECAPESPQALLDLDRRIVQWLEELGRNTAALTSLAVVMPRELPSAGGLASLAAANAELQRAMAKSTPLTPRELQPEATDGERLRPASGRSGVSSPQVAPRCPGRPPSLVNFAAACGPAAAPRHGGVGPDIHAA